MSHDHKFPSMEKKWVFSFVITSLVCVFLLATSFNMCLMSSLRPPINGTFSGFPTNGSKVEEHPPREDDKLPRLAYLVSGSKGDLESLWRTLRALYHPRNQYIVHLDLESPVDERLELASRINNDSMYSKIGNVYMITKANLVTYTGPTMVSNTLHACAILLKRIPDWDWFINLSASDYPLVTQDDLLYTFSTLDRNLNFISHTSDLGWKNQKRAMPLMIDPGLYMLNKSDIFRVTPGRSLPAAFKLFTGYNCYPQSLQASRISGCQHSNYPRNASRKSKAYVLRFCGRDALNPRRAKIAWKDVCKPKIEGGLGLRSLREANEVCVLKLLWRTVTAPTSLWVRWSRTTLMRGKSIWLISGNSSGTWMWKQILKCRARAASFLKVDIGNGRSTSFWYDIWSPLGKLLSLCGARGFIDMGIQEDATVEMAIDTHRRRRRHRVSLLNQVETEIEKARLSYRENDEDIFLWKSKGDKYKNFFDTATTREQLRMSYPPVSWSAGIWFTHHCPKFGFMAWLALSNRLSTGDRIQAWNTNTSPTCVLCQDPWESRDHLFFSCPYSEQVWLNLAGGILQQEYSTDWNMVVNLISRSRQHRVKGFLIRYLFQMTIHAIWRERNARRHGTNPSSPSRLIKTIDTGIRNKFTSIRTLGDRRYEEGMQIWFASRPIN